MKLAPSSGQLPSLRPRVACLWSFPAYNVDVVSDLLSYLGPTCSPPAVQPPGHSPQAAPPVRLSLPLPSREPPCCQTQRAPLGVFSSQSVGPAATTPFPPQPLSCLGSLVPALSHLSSHFTTHSFSDASGAPLPPRFLQAGATGNLSIPCSVILLSSQRPLIQLGGLRAARNPGAPKFPSLALTCPPSSRLPEPGLTSHLHMRVHELPLSSRGRDSSIPTEGLILPPDPSSLSTQRASPLFSFSY